VQFDPTARFSLAARSTWRPSTRRRGGLLVRRTDTVAILVASSTSLLVVATIVVGVAAAACTRSIALATRGPACACGTAPKPMVRLDSVLDLKNRD
jgi:hypothetical protein